MQQQQQHKADFHSRYDIIARLGKGQFSTVYEVLEKSTNQHFAGKVVNKSACPASALETELSILSQLDHPQTIRIKEVFNTEEVCIIVQELITGGELFDRISEQGVFSEKYAAKFFRELLLVVKYLHDKNIVHRDLKPENIMLSDRSEDAVIKVIDFGASKFAAHDKAITGLRGTPPYMAPEIFDYKSYGKPVDMWALGVILYVLLAGMFPYDPDERKFDCPFFSPEFDNITDSAKDILLKLMDRDTDKRHTVDQALCHSWVTGENASELTMSVSNLRQMVAKKKFKRAVETIRASNRFRSMLKHKQSSTELQPRPNFKVSQHKDAEKLKDQLRKVTESLDAASKSLQEAIDGCTDVVDGDVAAAAKKLREIKQSIHSQSSLLKSLPSAK